MGDRRGYDRRVREAQLRILCAAEMTHLSPMDAVARFEVAFVQPIAPPGPRERTPYFAVERMEDELPSPEQWAELREAVYPLLREIGERREALEDTLRVASPRWRVDRMPPVDRSLLLMGTAEMLRAPVPSLRPVFHDLIELAKAYGSDTTPRFVNGILDQIRRNLDLPFR